MKQLVAVLLFTLVLACGGGNSGNGGNGGNGNGGNSLDTGFAKAWTGTATVTGTGVTTFSYPSQIVITVSGDTATITQVCPNGPGAITATGTGRSADWNGNLACAIPQYVNCFYSLTYTSASMTLSADNTTLNAVATGTVTGCSLTGTLAISTTFQGH